MKQLSGVPHKISRFNKADYVLVSEKASGGYAASLLAGKAGGKSPRVSQIPGLDVLCEGDVVSINEAGVVSVLFEKQAGHNCLFVTDRCNCRCVMCPQALGTEVDDYRIGINKRIVSLLDKTVSSLGITGGEPTIARAGLLDLIGDCKRLLPKTALTLLSNGINFSDVTLAQELARIGHPDLQVDIAVYADTDELHNRIVGAKAFWKTLKGVHNLGRFSQRIGIRVVVHKLNYLRLPQIAEFIYHNMPFVQHVAFMQMETTGAAKDNLELLWVDPFEYNDLLEQAVWYLHQRDMNASVYNTQLCVLKPSLWRFARKSISDWKNEYHQECAACSKRRDCGGLFSTSSRQSSHIKAL